MSIDSKSVVEFQNQNEFSFLDFPQQYHNLTFRQIGEMNEKRLLYLHELFDK